MTKLTLTSLTRFDKDRDGNPLKTKDGRTYTRLFIRAKEYGDKPISGFDSIQTQNWREGDEVEVEVEQKGEYLNFKVPNKTDQLTKVLEEIRNTQLKHTMYFQEVISFLSTGKKTSEYPEFEGEPNFDVKNN